MIKHKKEHMIDYPGAAFVPREQSNALWKDYHLVYQLM